MNENGKAENGSFNNRPVAPEESGEGAPYAPENWPQKGDNWGWRTGRRITPAGYFQDRYLYLPERLNNHSGSARKQHIFASKLAVERYLKANFPEADLGAFFSSFTWRIPAVPYPSTNGNMLPIAAVPLKQIPAEQSDSDTEAVRCKAGNKKCASLILEEVEKYSPAMSCDICCSEPGFCRDCCCILCSKMVSSAYGGYSFIKCQAKNDEAVCGHVAHMECALRARLAGTVGRSIGLDAEYHCRRCDVRTDLISYVNKLLQTCDTIDSDDEIQRKILNLGACILRGSQRADAKELLRHIELAISKLHQLKCGTNREDTWMPDDSLTAYSTGLSDHDSDVMEATVHGSPSNVTTGEESYDCLPQSLKFEAEVDQVLYALKKSQEFEYKLAEERLQSHKTYLQNLYQQLDLEKSQLECKNSSNSYLLSHTVRKRKEQIGEEVAKFKVMKKIANGFGKTSKDILKEHFDVEITD
ncbi:protein OBERON 1 isoform X1 [Arachis ipaensis]|uniref:protein OBERON 1 isoform X1 n=1 Tax=Arachis ipaensis TaxID=130454 RepID=UPI0007AFC515|nr:protein OBERON 1 isoform X1 [Arachis ipaensis]XP_025654071.1 protein OBERON 1 isoform X1 [Arachis hypogaea]QHO11310.1 Protein OBERON [Arachis hypogaea]QHO11311.1 Protein OBERON [Arachis hypogaea]